MTVSTTQTRVSYTGDGSSVNFPIPFPFYIATDLLVLLAGTSITTGFSITGGNGSTGTLVMAVAPLAAVNLQIVLNVPLTQLVNLVDGTAFPSATINQVNDRAVQGALRLKDLISRCIGAPDGDVVPGMQLPAAAVRASMYLAFDSSGNVLPTSALPGTANTPTSLGNIIYPRSQAEINAGVFATQPIYPYGCPRRFGNANTGNGTQDDTVAVQTAINSSDTYVGWSGDIYGVTTITFPLNGPHKVDFNGSWIRGIAGTATNAIVVIACDRTTFIDYRVDGNFSQFYLCGTQWYNASASSQYNSVFGITHRFLGGIQTASGTTVRAMIYGALVGASSTSFAQSENQMYGWRTYGCQNPFYSNHNNGVLQFTDPIFVCVAEGWPGGSLTPSAPWSYANGRTLEVVKGTVNTKGGEIQIATAGTTFAAELAGGCFFDDVIIETDVPIRINGDGVRFSGGRYLQDQLQPCFKIAAGCTGVFSCSDMYFTRPANTGSFDNNPLIDASAVTGVFEVILSDTESYEYRWTCVGADVRLVSLGANTAVRYKNHRMSMTAADPNVYVLNTGPTDSVLDITAFDRLGYTTNGWQLTQDFGGGTTLTVTTSAGPTGYLASQIQLLAPSGQQAIATYGNPTSLATLKTSSVFVRPGELYWVAAWCNEVTGTGGKLSARFFTLTGAVVGDVPIADSGSISAASWKYMAGPLPVPATAAYMCIGLYANNGTIALTDLRVRRAA